MGKSKSDWHLQTKLEKCLLSSVIITAILLIGALIFIVIKLTIITNTSCVTPICISAANKILKNIDLSANPCDNFFKFSCGNFIRQHSAGDSKLKPLKERIKDELEKLIKQPIHEDDHYLVKNQKILFQSCMKQTENKEENLNYFKNILKEINGWPLLQGEKWIETDWEKVSFKLREKGLHYSSFLDIKVDSDPLNVTNNIVYINEPFMLNLKDKHKDLRLKYMMDSVTYLGANKKIVEKDIYEIYEFDKALINITSKNEYKFDNITEEILLRRDTVKNFQKRNNQINWLNFINNFLNPIAEISENDHVIFPVQEYIDAFFDLMNTTTNRVKVNTIVWSLFDSLINFFPDELESFDVSYRCIKDGYLNEMKTFDKCKFLILRSFEFLPTDMVYAQKILSPEHKNQIKDLVKYIKSEFYIMLSEASWMDQQSKDNALKKLAGVIAVLGNEDYFQDPVLKMFEDRTLNANDTTMMLYINSRKLFIDMQYAQILFPGNHNKFRAINRDANSINANYMADRNVIALFTGILQNNFFNPNQSKYLNYGNLGTIVGHELTHGFCKFASEYDEAGNRAMMWTAHTEEGFTNASQCVLDESDNFEITGSDKKMNSSKTFEENLADFVGVKIAYRAYRKWVEEHEEELPLVGLDYTPYQLFWISAVSDYCYEMDKSDIENVIKHDPHAINVFRVNAPLRNNADFAKDFKCPVDSMMNPSKKCVVF